MMQSLQMVSQPQPDQDSTIDSCTWFGFKKPECYMTHSDITELELLRASFMEVYTLPVILLNVPSGHGYCVAYSVPSGQ